MAKKKYSELPQEDITNTSIIPFENGSGETRRNTALDTSVLFTGLSVQYVTPETPFPAPVGGFIRLVNGIKYILTEATTTLTSPILLEAGVETEIDTVFSRLTNLEFSGFTGTAIQTLNLSGTILEFADSGTSPGIKTTVTSVAHPLSNNDKVNIFGVATETQYNGTGFTVTNVTANTFDITVAFTDTDTGSFDTGVTDFRVRVRIDDATGPPGVLQLFDITYTPAAPGTTYVQESGIIGFANLGIIRDAASCAIENNAAFTVDTDGLILENIGNIRIGDTGFFSFSGASLAIALTIQGAATTNLDMDTTPFNLASGDAFPMKINTDISSTATIKIGNCSATATTPLFFDTSGGGIDQTDVRVVITGSLPSPDSQSMSESLSNGVLEVDGSGSVDVPIVDITPVAGDWIEDATTEEWSVNTITGVATYIGLQPKSVTIRYELSASPTSGGSQTIIFDMHLNGVAQTKSSRTLVTSTAGTFTQVTYIGGSFNVENGDTVQLFKNNTTNTTNTDVQDATLIIIKNG